MQIETGSFVPDRLLEPTGLGCLVIVARHHGLHLTVPQLVHDNVLTGPEVSVAELLKSASGAGLKAKAVRLTWNGLIQLKKALPAIVRFEHGGCMVLLRLEGIGDTVHLLLQDPDAGDDAVLLIDQLWFEKVWTGEVVFVKRNYARGTIESPPSVPSDLQPSAQNTSARVPTSLGNVHPQSRVRRDKSHFGLTAALDEVRANLGSREPLGTRSASALAKETPNDIAQAMDESLRPQIRARIGEARTTANTRSTASAPAISVATGVVGRERALSRAPPNLIPSSSSRLFVLAAGAATTAIIWASILATQSPISRSIANLVQTNLPKMSNVDRGEINKTTGRIDSDVGSKSKNTNLSSTNANDGARALDRQQGGTSAETSPLPTPADAVNGAETKSNVKTLPDVQQLSNGDRIARPQNQPPAQSEINKAEERTEVDSDIGRNSKNTNFLSTNGDDATRALDKQSESGASREMSPLPTQADSMNGTETEFNSKITTDVQQPSNGDRSSRTEYQLPIQREINKTNDRMEVDSDLGSKSKNTNLLSTNGNDATRARDRQSNQGDASSETPPLQTPADSVNGAETNSDLKTMAGVQQLSNGDRIPRPEYQPPIQRGVNRTSDRMQADSDIGPKSKNTNFLSTNGKDVTRSPAKPSNQHHALTEKLPAIESKSLRTPVDSVNRSEASSNLRTAVDVQRVQQRLVELGYLPFLPDGVWGPHSIQALRAFRATAGLGGGDQWDRKTEDILFATTAPKATAPTASPLQLPPG